MSGKTKDIKLFEEDVVQILSKNDIEADKYFKISGEVMIKVYPFSENLSS